MNQIGAFIISDISFKTKKDRKRFEKFWKIKKKDILVDEYVNSDGFVAWTVMRNPELDVVYFLGFLGYAEPKIMLEQSLARNIKIKFMAWLPINDRQAEWEKIRGRW